MTIILNITDRKPLVKLIADYTGEKPVYLKAPSYAYQIGEFTISREGNLEAPDTADSEAITALLTKAGYQPETKQTATVGMDMGLTISIPLDKVDVGNLANLLESKGSLIKKALGIDKLPFEVSEEAVSFCWFSTLPGPEEIKAYSQLITAICQMSKSQKRITAKEKDVDNEKYAFRCFLLRLGFIGDEFKQARKLLLRNLAGNSAFKSAKKTYKVELDNDNFKTFDATSETEAQEIAWKIAEELGSDFCEVSEVN